MKRVILVHGWQGQPGNHWKGWLRRELESRDIEVIEPNMPNESSHPEDWINKLRDVVGVPDKNLVLVGHSLGCPTVVGYLMTMKEDSFVAGAVFVAGFVSRIPNYEPLKEWDFDLVEVQYAKDHCGDYRKNFVSIVSDNDSDVPPEKSKELNDLLCGELIVEHNKGHFCEEDGVKELPSALSAILKIFGL